MDRSSRQKINEETLAFNDTLDKMNFIERERERERETFHPKTSGHRFFSSAHRAFSRMDHILDHKFQ